MSEEVAQPAPKQSKAKQQEQWKPSFQGQQEFTSHLFKLTDAKMLKKVVLGPNQESVQDATHNHFFHTQDSSGKHMNHSVATGGHFHIMTIEWDAVTGAPKATCSGPKQFIHNKKTNRKIISDMPVLGAHSETGEDIRDNHTHDVVYLQSSKGRPRVISAQAATFLDTTTPKPVVGIKG